ncbi:hypothetical protein B0T26DRAFT_731810 [Lasiosphaeria miniovina]|uniref:Uncharacterized protein n=1 Tax=Lasiosphaeria miniovina TaxID=1954250 RepID=A0AA39ZTY9_9PEZI|nr:uncharacterized protein B0T26DRAFT_731810 [Lasiosphaeria miniovina]KAK0703538.1 hypothetical protein B0T26DRAFT_731810 [Lasiosphaeria miniovina]
MLDIQHKAILDEVVKRVIRLVAQSLNEQAKLAWPTLVIEAGFSQSLGELHIAMRRWFSMSNHEVKIVLLAKFNGTTIL